MKNRITLQVVPPKDYEKHLLNKRDVGSFIVGAQEDYFLTRILLWVGLHDSGMYHYQQAIEKYIKAYLIQNGEQFKDTHDLERLAALASKFDNFFCEKEFVDACKAITPFEEVGRYPQVKIRAFGWTFPDILFFLDEFIFDMREKVERKRIYDIVEEIKKGNIGIGSNYFTNTSQLISLFYKDNQYFKENE